MLATSLSMFLLRPVKASQLEFPRWQPALAVMLIGLLSGLDPAMRSASPGMPALPLWWAILMSVVSTWVVFLVTVLFLRWWLKRGARWDGRGRLFNLVVAGLLIANLASAALMALGVPAMITLPLGLYGIWVVSRALASLLDKASFNYCLGGVLLAGVISVIAVMLVTAILSIPYGVFLAASGGQF